MKVFLGVVCLATLLYESHAFYYPLSITPHITSWGTFSGHEQSHEVRVGRLSRTCSMKRISYQALSFTNLRMSSTTPISTDGKARITLAKQVDSCFVFFVSFGSIYTFIGSLSLSYRNSLFWRHRH